MISCLVEIYREFVSVKEEFARVRNFSVNNFLKRLRSFDNTILEPILLLKYESVEKYLYKEVEKAIEGSLKKAIDFSILGVTRNTRFPFPVKPSDEDFGNVILD